MSFHIQFATASVERAKHLVAEHLAPDCVKAFLTAAIEGAHLRTRDSAVYLVKATGHLCDDGQSYDVSNAQIEVRAIPLS